MPRQIIDDSVWEERIPAANLYYKSWEGLFKCEVLNNYYEGKQWMGQTASGEAPYVINKVYETVQIKIDEFVPSFPKYNVTSRPGNSDYNLELAGQSSQLKEDVLNTIIDNDGEVFTEEMGMAYKDSFFRFGIVEVGYGADWVLNPNAPRPLLNTQTDKVRPSKVKVKNEPKELPINERIFFKHIGAKRFRVGGIDHKYLHRCGWCGYYDWIAKDDLLAIPNLMNRDKVIEAAGFAPNSEQITSDNKKLENKPGNNLKIWKLWDNRAMVQLLVLDSPKVTIFQRSFKRLPLFDYRPDKSLITEGFYPIPPVYHWLSPQDELNETRQQLRNHRRRFNRKFQIVENTIDDEEIEKFESGVDGSLIKVKQPGAISAIDDPNLGSSLDKAIATSTDDLNQISGTSVNARGEAARTTATEATIISQKATSREKAEQSRIIKWYVRIGREVLLTVRDKFTLGIWAKLTADPGEQLFGVIQENKAAYQWVSNEDLSDGFDFSIKIDVTTLNEVAQQQEKTRFVEFLALTTQFPQIALSPVLIREAAYRVGYRNEKVIKEMQTMALIHMRSQMMQAQSAQAQLGSDQTGGNLGQTKAAQMAGPSIEQARNQLQGQLGV